MARQSPYRRERQGDGFIYFDGDRQIADRSLLDWIESLVIPPAWNRVEIARSKGAKVLATGYDAAGRKQAIYHPKFRERQERLKFDRILRFAVALPKLRRQLDRDLARKRLGREKVLACIVRLIDQDYFRVGNETYAKQNQTYGITTLRSKHVEVRGDTVVFDFIGKSGKEQMKTITDAQIARIVRRLDELPGAEIFRYQDNRGQMHDIDSSDVNDYIKRHMGDEFTAKDFRTWGGTLLATTELIVAERATSEKERKKYVTRVVKNVAAKLGNTPAVARSSYIDPRVIAAYVDSNDLGRVRAAMEKMRPKKYLTRDEQAVLHLLNG